MIVCRLLYQQLFPQNPLGIIQVLPWQCGCQGLKGCLKAQVGVLLLDFSECSSVWLDNMNILLRRTSCDFLNPLALRLELSSQEFSLYLNLPVNQAFVISTEKRKSICRDLA